MNNIFLITMVFWVRNKGIALSLDCMSEGPTIISYLEGREETCCTPF